MPRTAAVQGFIRSTPEQHAPRAFFTTRDLLSTAAAAARLAMTGKQYSPDDKADCAADVAARIMSGFPAPVCLPGQCGGEAFYTVPIADDLGGTVRVPRCVKHAAGMDDAHLIPPDAAFIPQDAGSFTRCANLAANYRRGLDRQRARDEREANANAAHDGMIGPGPDAALIRPVAPTADAAHAAARDMLSDLGLPRLGKAYPLAYTAARSVVAKEARLTPEGKPTGEAVYRTQPADLATAAAELGYTGKTPSKALGMALKRAADSIPSVAVKSREQHCSALGIEPSVSPARKASATRTHSADLGEQGWRGKDSPGPDAAAVKLRKGEVAADIAPPEWTADLPAGTRARLEAGVARKRARMAAKTPEQRAADRAAAGIPDTVR